LNNQPFSRQLVLASSSVYRQELLQRLQIPFVTASPGINEAPFSNEAPGDTALRLSREKARVVAKSYPNALIIGADQVAVLDKILLGKPLSHCNAVKQLRFMRGKEVVFYTALSLFNSHSEQIQSQVIPCCIKFRQLSNDQIENYLHKEQPYHCAGSTKSEGLGIALIERMTGDDPSALIGLPLIALVEMLMNESVMIV